jgi:hypothetical protein
MTARNVCIEHSALRANRLLQKDQLLAREHTTRANGIAAQAKKKSPPPNFETPF